MGQLSRPEPTPPMRREQRAVAQRQAEDAVGITPVERALAMGDLAQLQPKDRMDFLAAICESTNLNPLTRPFEFITLQGKLTLYARAGCADQLAARDGVSEEIIEEGFIDDDLYRVRMRATFPDGRSIVRSAVLSAGNLKGEALANALMKCETKAHRRVIMSACGLGIPEEGDHGAEEGEIINVTPVEIAKPSPLAILGEKQKATRERKRKLTAEQSKALVDRARELFHGTRAECNAAYTALVQEVCDCLPAEMDETDFLTLIPVMDSRLAARAVSAAPEAAQGAKTPEVEEYSSVLLDEDGNVITDPYAEE